MQRRALGLILTLLIPGAASAAEQAKVRLPGGASATISLEKHHDGAAVTMAVPGQPNQIETALGEEFIPVAHKGKQSLVPVVDLDGDGTDEFFVRVAFPPQGGALWLYKWNAAQNRFTPVPHDGKEFISVDYAAPVKLDEKNRLEIHISRFSGGKKSMVKEFLNWKGKAYAK